MWADKTGEAARDYLARYPQGKHAERALGILESLAYADAGKRDTLEAYLKHLETYPRGPNAWLVRKDLRRLLFGEGSSGKVPGDPREALSRYLAAAPNGEYVGQARAAIDSIDWLEAYLADTEASYGSYLSLHPDGMYGDEARGHIRSKGPTPPLRIGMSRAEVEKALGPCAVETDLYRDVREAVRYGRYARLEYPTLGICCCVRQTAEWEKVYSLAFDERYSGDCRGVRISMTRDEVTALLGVTTPRQGASEHTLEYLDRKRPGDFRSGFYVTLSGEHHRGDEYRDVTVSTDQSLLDSHLVRHQAGLRSLDPGGWRTVLTGRRLVVARSFGKDRVIRLSLFDEEIHGPFAVARIPKPR